MRELTHNEVEVIAEICHEANRTYCESHGDTSQKPWKDAPDWQRTSAINGVENAMNPDTKPSDSHEHWLKEKLDNGWTYGPVKNPDIKQHPCCVPFEQLPDSQKRKDVIFLAVARAVAKALTGPV